METFPSGNLSTNGALPRARVNHLKVFSHEGESGSTPSTCRHRFAVSNSFSASHPSPRPTNLLPALPVSSSPTSLPAAFPVTLCSPSVHLPVISPTNQPTGAQRNSVTSVTTRKITSPLLLSQRLKLRTKLFAGKEERKVRGEDRPHRDEMKGHPGHLIKRRLGRYKSREPSRRADRGIPESRARPGLPGAKG